MSDCREIFEGLSDFIDEELSQDVCAEIMKHLEGCHNCRVVVNTLQHTIELYHTYPQEEVPEEVRTRLYKTIRLAKEGD